MFTQIEIMVSNKKLVQGCSLELFLSSVLGSNGQWAVGSRQVQGAPDDVTIYVQTLGTKTSALGHGQC